MAERVMWNRMIAYRNLWIVPAMVALSIPTYGVAPFTTVAVTGQPAPGMPDGTTFTGFDRAAIEIDKDGHVAFEAALTNVNDSIWTNVALTPDDIINGSSLHPIALEG